MLKIVKNSLLSFISWSIFSDVPVVEEKNAKMDVEYKDVSLSVYDTTIDVVNNSGARYAFVVSCNNDESVNYFVQSGEEAVLPLTEGIGKYDVKMYEHLEDSKYRYIQTVSFETDKEYEYLTPNAYVQYRKDMSCIRYAKAVRLVHNDTFKVHLTAMYIKNQLTYSKEKLDHIPSFYMTDLYEVERSGKASCLDYAVMFAAMLRTEGIPCKVAVGYCGDVYHAWNEVFVNGEWKTCDLVFAEWYAKKGSDRTVERYY